MIKRAIFFVLLALLFSPPVFAGHYVVNSTTASTNWSNAEWTNYPDAFSGTACTMGTAFDNAVAGDVVYFRGGTYSYDSFADDKNNQYYPANDGTSGSYIEFRNYPSEAPVFEDTNANEYNGGMMGTGGDGDGVADHTRSYIIFNGLKFTKQSGLDGSPRMGIIQSDNIIIKNCEFAGQQMNDFPHGNYDLIRIEDSSYITVQNCLLYGVAEYQDGHGSAIKDYSSHHVTIEKCTIYDCDVAFERKGSNEYCTFRYNYIYNIGVYGANKQVITLVQGSGANEGDHYLDVYQNVYYADYADATSFFKMDNEAAINTDGIQFWNNTIHSQQWGYINAQKAADFEAWNNIVVGVDSARYIVETQDNVTYAYMDYNLYYPFTKMDAGSTNYSTWAGWTSSGELTGGGNPDVNSIEGSDPQFVSPGAGGPENYKLQAGSPAENAGIDRQDYDDDGNTTESINMGAYITGSEQIGYDSGGAEDTTAPQFSSASINSAGDTLTVNWTEPCNQDTDWQNSDINLDVSGGSTDIALTYSSGNGTSQWIFSIGELVYENETVNIDMTDGADAIDDDADNNMAAFTDQSVANGSGVSEGGTSPGGSTSVGGTGSVVLDGPGSLKIQ